jgi:integrase
MTKRPHGDGGIDARGPNSWRLRYRINGKRYTKSFRGTKTEALKELRRLLRSGDTGEHVEPSRLSVAQWVDRWIASGAPGRNRIRAGRRAIERYDELLRCHVLPTLGGRSLQQLQAVEIDTLYAGLGTKLKPRTAHHVHTVFNACLGTAERKGLIVAIRGSPLYPIVAVAASTGARRNEILALRWTDIDPVEKTLTIERALEETKAGLTFKAPKTKRGTRTITIDDD